MIFNTLDFIAIFRTTFLDSYHCLDGKESMLYLEMLKKDVKTAFWFADLHLKDLMKYKL